MKWMNDFMLGQDPDIKRNTFMWMLHGDNGEDNTKRLVLSVDDVEDPKNWIESGPHLMLMPKDPTSLDSFPTDFSSGAPFVMFKGTKFAHVMIPLNPAGTSGWTEASVPDGLAHNEAAWKIAAFSSAACRGGGGGAAGGGPPKAGATEGGGPSEGAARGALP